MNEKLTSNLSFSYYYDGGWWGLTIPAYSEKDALEIINRLPLARYDGIVYAKIYVPPLLSAGLLNRLTKSLNKITSFYLTDIEI